MKLKRRCSPTDRIRAADFKIRSVSSSRPNLRYRRRQGRTMFFRALVIAASSVVLLAALAGPAMSVDGPPIRRLPLSEVEPSRQVPAAEWRSPYCTRWTDGCTTCTRGTAREAAACAAGPGAEPACQRHTILCKDTDDYALHQVCIYRISFSYDPAVRRGGGGLDCPTWGKKGSKWTPTYKDIYWLANPGIELRRRENLMGLDRKYSTTICLATYFSDQAAPRICR